MVGHASQVNPAPFVVRASDGRVDGWATSPLPFEPKGPMLEYRQALREALGHMAPGVGQTLVAVFASADARRCDVENLLVYNLGISAFAHLHVDEVVLARSWEPPAPPGGVPTGLAHHHGYVLTTGQPPAPACGERLIAQLAPTPLRLPVRIERVWYDITSNGRMLASGVARDKDRLMVSLTVHRPPGTSRPALLGMVKVVVDGFVCALHRHDGTALDTVAQRLGARLGERAERVGDLLVANPVAALGVRRLLWPFGGYVQWNPADDGIVRLHVVTQPSPAWQLSGSVSAWGS